MNYEEVLVQMRWLRIRRGESTVIDPDPQYKVEILLIYPLRVKPEEQIISVESPQKRGTGSRNAQNYGVFQMTVFWQCLHNPFAILCNCNGECTMKIVRLQITDSVGRWLSTRC